MNIMKTKKGKMAALTLAFVAAAGGTIFFCRQGNVRGTFPAAGMRVADDVAGSPSADIDTSVPTATAMFPENGYSIRLPIEWRVERTGTGTIAVHPPAGERSAACKVEMSSFPFSAGSDPAAWIAERIGADPSVSVVERSSEGVSFDGASGVRWTGTIDGMTTTLVYAFAGSRAFEIAPSMIGGTDASPCDDMFGTFLSGLVF